jgi:hypothetical protein
VDVTETDEHRDLRGRGRRGREPLRMILDYVARHGPGLPRSHQEG